MKVEIKIPTMGESVSEAVVSAILKPNGSIVKVDEEILELETDKVNQVLYAPAAGELNLQVNIDETVKIAQVIGFVDTEKTEPKAPTKTSPEKPAVLAKAEITTFKQPEKEHNARKMQEDFLADVSESKKASPQPVLTKVKEPVAAEEKESRKKMTKLRKVIAEKLVEAKNSTAMLTTFNEIDMSAVMAIRAKEKDTFASRYGVRLGFMSFFVKAVVNALKMIPAVNAYIDGEDIVSVNTYDIGVAVATDKGLMVPVVRDCDKQSFGQIESTIENYAKKAREGTISVDDLKGGSFTITNGGRFGSLLSTPILNLPQSAILGMHAIVRRPIAVGDKIEIRPMMYVALSYDHRIIDGKEAVLFLVNIKENLEDPARLLLDL